MKVSQVTSGVKKAWKEAGNLLKNTEQFVEAVCLLIVSYGSYHYATNYELRDEYKWVLIFASVIIAMRGAILLIKHINKK